MKILEPQQGKRCSEPEYLTFTHKRCGDCGEIKTVQDFHRKKTKTNRGWAYDSHCIQCRRRQSREYGTNNRKERNKRLRKWRRKNPSAAKINDKRGRYMKKYGLTLDQVDALKSANNYCCWICNRKHNRLFVDHCHETGKVRGILCPSCNTYLGIINDDPLYAMNAVNYLQGESKHADVLLELANETR